MSTEGWGKRPYKVWDCFRQIRKGLVASTFSELIERGREKLEIGEVRVRIVLESDGTQIDDAEYFSTLPENTTFLFLRQGEHWYPAGVEVLRQAITAIPKIVCETIYSLGLHDEAPVWKVMDQYGKITVILSWDSRPQRGKHEYAFQGKPIPGVTARVIVSGVGESTLQRQDFLSTQPTIGPSTSPIPSATFPGVKSPVPPVGATPLGTVTTILRDGKKETLINDIAPTLPGHPQVCKSAPFPQQEIDAHVTERRTSRQQQLPHPPPVPAHTSQSPKVKPLTSSPLKPPHVRFQPEYRPAKIASPSKKMPMSSIPGPEHESSESETENTTNDEEGQTSQKVLLLIDQPPPDARRHLSIKDIGVILDRLSSKIVDIERMERDIEEENCYNWTIKATIRGDVLRELGVLYGGHYYTICEHPAYSTRSEDDSESRQDEEDPV